MNNFNNNSSKNNDTCGCSDKLWHVGCDAVNCKYHGSDNHCHAESINVGATNAVKKDDTFCGTFCARSEF